MRKCGIYGAGNTSSLCTSVAQHVRSYWWYESLTGMALSLFNLSVIEAGEHRLPCPYRCRAPWLICLKVDWRIFLVFTRQLSGEVYERSFDWSTGVPGFPLQVNN
jgi:hypothetical protein